MDGHTDKRAPHTFTEKKEKRILMKGKHQLSALDGYVRAKGSHSTLEEGSRSIPHDDKESKKKKNNKAFFEFQNSPAGTTSRATDLNIRVRVGVENLLLSLG